MKKSLAKIISFVASVMLVHRNYTAAPPKRAPRGTGIEGQLNRNYVADFTIKNQQHTIDRLKDIFGDYADHHSKCMGTLLKMVEIELRKRNMYLNVSVPRVAKRVRKAALKFFHDNWETLLPILIEIKEKVGLPPYTSETCNLLKQTLPLQQRVELPPQAPEPQHETELQPVSTEQYPTSIEDLLIHPPLPPISTLFEKN